jgi:hypothetical protein
LPIGDFLDAIKIQWYTDSMGQKQSIQIDNEVGQIINGKLTLSHIPDYFYKVEIAGLSETTEGNLTSNQFRVNYHNGDVIFHPSREGQNINITRYFARGVVLYPASRIYTKMGTAGQVEITLQNLIDSIQVGEGNYGDMYKITYDVNNNGIVDNSERLGNELPTFYASKAYADISSENMRKNTTKTFCLEVRTSDPVNPVLGQMWVISE